MVLVIDNYDSFTYNLVQYLGELGADDPRACATTRSRSTRSRRCSPTQIVISPGPGRPEDAGITMDVIRALRSDDADPRRLPRPSGDRRRLSAARSCRAAAPMHGKTSTVVHDGKGVFTGIAGAVPGRPLSLADHRRRRRAGRARSDGADAARTARSWGVRHRTLPGARRAVPSRVGPDRRRPADSAELPRLSAGLSACLPH